MGTVNRNDPCPCGSGKKHKKCCLGKVDKKSFVLAKIIAGIGVMGGAIVAASYGWRYGAGVGATGLIIAAGVAIFGNPPPPNKNKNPAGIDFGM